MSFPRLISICLIIAVTITACGTTAMPTYQVIYYVQEGDTLQSIADKYGVTVDEIMEINNITNPEKLAVGQSLRIPRRSKEAEPDISSTITPTATNAPSTEYQERYQGRALLVIQAESEIVVENIYGSPLAIRVSWDKCDPWGDGDGPECDSYLDNWVEYGEHVRRSISNHTSVQIWAWDTSGALVDSCDFLITTEPLPDTGLPIRTEPPSGVRLQLLIPLYSYPNWYDPDNYIWDEVAAANSQVPITAIINPSNGPGDGPSNSDYQRGLGDLRTAGVTILGYVYTSYGARDINIIRAEVDLYDQDFNIDGIFFDQVTSGAGQLSYYEELYDYVKSCPNLDKVFLNPGTHIAQGYLSSTHTYDTAVIFEDYSSEWSSYRPDDYVTSTTHPAERFAILAHTIPDADTMRSHIDLAVARNVGYVYVTDDTLDNPWDSLPTFWQAEIDYIASLNADAH